MTELFNSLKAFASSTSSSVSASAAVATNSIGNRSTQFSKFHQPLMTLGRADSCTESGFNQWRDAMRMVARLPGGLPPEFRIRLWENLADRYLQAHHIDWARIATKCLSGNSRDQEIADQIEKDLHRTGCTGFSGAKQVVLKQVLVSYSRWNPAVGYCQGFNMIGAMLLQMTNGNEKLTLKIFIFLIEGVLPEGYFGQGLRGLAVEMAVFREILKFRKPTLNAHLSRLQKKDNSPPLTDVFTMHWFLTLFIHCLPPQTVLRVWDLILLEGSEILLRTSLVLWAAIETRILSVKNTDEFYSVMGVVTREMLEYGLMEPNALMKCVVSVGPFPFPGLDQLRQTQRVIISKDAPCKSFFLAKRELDSLKRHYAAIRHRQRATTIIFKGPDPHAKGQNSRLLVVPTKKQVISPKPKVRRQGSGKNINAASPQITSKNLATPHGGHTKNVANNSIIHVHNINHSNNRSKQVTVGWDKSLKNKFRRRRSSASSHTSTSSSTELCDSSSSDNEESSSNFSQPVWVDPKSVLTQDSTENKTEVKAPPAMTMTEPPITTPAESLNAPDGTEPVALPNPEIVTNDGTNGDAHGDGDLEPELEELLSAYPDMAERTETPKCIDTNDSQHFLDEMSRLGKSDSFYENLSQRICELQFQNLTLLTTCNTTVDKENSLVVEQDFLMSSPLPSPISPIGPVKYFYTQQDSSKLSASPKMRLSPRGSISSNGESPLPRSPLSPSPDPNFANLLSLPRKNSKSSVSSLEINDDKEGRKSQVSQAEELGNFETVDGCQIVPSVSLSPISPIPSRLFTMNLIRCKEDAEEFDVIGASSSRKQAEDEAETVDTLSPCPEETNGSTSPFIASGAELVLEPNASGVLLGAANDEAVGGISPDSPSHTGQTSEEDINTVIRENIAILQRLKMKPAYGDDTGNDFDYFEYYSTDTEDDEAFSKDVDTNGKHKPIKSSNQNHSHSQVAAAPGAPGANKTTRSRSNSSSSKGKTCTKCVKSHKPKKPFNPFPTTRRPRVKSVKFGLYSS